MVCWTVLKGERLCQVDGTQKRRGEERRGKVLRSSISTELSMALLSILWCSLEKCKKVPENVILQHIFYLVVHTAHNIA